MTRRQEKFVAEYVKDLNASRAARVAGYSAKRADQSGYQALRSIEVAGAVREAIGRDLRDSDVSAARVLEELRRVAFTDVRSLFDEKGDLIPVTEWTAEQGSALASFEVARASGADTVRRVKLVDKVKALEMLAKHFALLVDRRETSAAITVTWLPPDSSARSSVADVIDVAPSAERDDRDADRTKGGS
jgi:phage terminase small subunit